MKQIPTKKFLAKDTDSPPNVETINSRPVRKFLVSLIFSVCLTFTGNIFADDDDREHSNERGHSEDKEHSEDREHSDDKEHAHSNKKSIGNLHTIELMVEKLEGGYFAYRMKDYVISEMDGDDAKNITSRYPNAATIPGPTIVINEGDEVDLKLIHSFDPASTGEEQVSVHVHGVHYDIISDGTLKYINLLQDESATPSMYYEYRWVAAPGTAGTWAYHDHNMNSHNGAEDRGLFGALIVNSTAHTEALNIAGNIKTVPLSSIKKDYVLYLNDDAFWGTEINSKTGQQSAGGINPSFSAKIGSNVRFHIIALGTNLHQFTLNGYDWVDPGTNMVIGEKAIGPLEKHVFTVQAGNSTSYADNTFTSKLLGMEGDFNVTP